MSNELQDWERESLAHLAYQLNNMTPVSFSRDLCDDVVSWLTKFSKRQAADHHGDAPYCYIVETNEDDDCSWPWNVFKTREACEGSIERGRKVTPVFTAPPRVVDVELSARRVITAFEAHGKTRGASEIVKTHHECEAAMVALKAALEKP